MKHIINNFVDMDRIEVETTDYSNNKDIGEKLVGIFQRAGSMSFQHQMTIDQAKQMASALLECCKELEGVTA